MASTTAVTETTDPKPKAANKVRKRAPKACLSCRARKVRCDVSQRGRPCMNCYLDSETCVVTGRASRFRRTQRDNPENVQAAFPPYAPDNTHHAPTAEEIVKSRATGKPVPDKDNASHTPENVGHRAEPLTTPGPSVERPVTAQSQPQSQYNSQLLNGQPRPHPTARPNPYIAASLPSPSSQQPLQLNSDIVYSYYPFLSVSNLPNMFPQDVNYLELQGCFRVPTKAILDEFVQQYFLHVHPLLPLFNEGDFWDIYCQEGPVAASGQRISLLAFQSLIFASCNFVSRNSIKALGFTSIRTARAALYRRAKLLYDLESESSPICIAQAGLLLSFWSPLSGSGARKPNSTWLSIAIHHARAAEAHRYSSFTSSAPSGPSAVPVTQLKRQNTLKRIWWCCVIRDRVLPLCMRRGIQITRAHFDFDGNSPLGAADMADEVDRSKVYNSGTKRALIEIMAQVIDLCVLLTDMLVLVYPLDDTPGWGKMMGPNEMERVREAKFALRRWYKGATLKFPMFGGGSGARRSSNIGSDSGAVGGGREFYHDSVILYTNLMYMYYHSCRVALCHHEVLHLAIASTQPNVGITRDVSTIYENRHELQDAASGVTECLKELIQLRLARWLPISAVACTALPLVLHILDVKLSSPRPGSNDASGDAYSQSSLKQHRLNILIEAMKTYQPQYDGVDWISETTRHIINLAQLDAPPETAAAGSGDANADGNGNGTGTGTSNGNGNGNSNGTVCDWTDILTSHPSLYLRLALTMDLSLSKDRIPEEGDFPASLRGLFTGGFHPLQLIFGAKEREAQKQRQMLRPIPGSLSSMSAAGGPSNGYRTPGPGGVRGGGGGVAPPRMMKEFLAGDQMLSFGMQMGIDMELDDTAMAGMCRAEGLPDSDLDSESDSQSQSHSDDDDDGQSGRSAAATSDDGGGCAAASPGGLAHGAEDGHQHHHQHQHQQPAFQPFTAEEMDGLEAHVLDVFMLHNESPASYDGSGGGHHHLKGATAELFGDALGQDTAGEWMEQAWADEGRRREGAADDGETARALLDAMKGGEVPA